MRIDFEMRRLYFKRDPPPVVLMASRHVGGVAGRGAGECGRGAPGRPAPRARELHHAHGGAPWFYPRNHVGGGWGIRNGAIAAVRIPKILILTSPPAAGRHGLLLAVRQACAVPAADDRRVFAS